MTQPAMQVRSKTWSTASRRAFTLVELLVVITIIGILASLVLVAANAARRTANQAAIRTEITSLDAAFVQYGNDVSGGSYPPNLMTGALARGDATDSTATISPQQRAAVLANLKRHFNAAFPKHREPAKLLEALCGCNSSGAPLTLGTGLPGGMTPQQALVFWLGGFSDDPKYPISGPGGPSYPDGGTEDLSARLKNSLFDFEETRLGPRNNDNNFAGTVISYPDPFNSGRMRRINLWQYRPRNLTQPYAYFDTSREPLDTLPLSSGPKLLAVKQRKNTVANPNQLTVAEIRYANEGKCQILSAGLDDEWGPFVATQGVNFSNKTENVTLLLYPEGPFVGDIGDTITNFSSSATLEASQP